MAKYIALDDAYLSQLGGCNTRLARPHQFPPIAAVQASTPTKPIAPAADRLAINPRPRWDRETMCLWLGNEVVREFKREAHSQFIVLDALQAAGWPASMPFPKGVSAKDTVESLNDGLVKSRLRICRQKKDTALSWRITA
jgi:hypothetical protein